jgi:oligopeptide/dipeptide ABC transporter ATP-binding protein
MSSPLLVVENLRTYFKLRGIDLRAVDGVSFGLSPGRTLGVIGESGSGKSVMARSIIGLLSSSVQTEVSGAVKFDGRNLLNLSESEMRTVRGRDIAMIFQDPMTSLNPVMSIGRQIVQVLRNHTDLSRNAAKERAVELLAEVGIPAPRQRATEYAHRMSGGMRQRIVIAIALACNPRLLIADEPTTALDVTVQAQILNLLRTLQQKHDMALMLITHNFGVIAEMCDDVAVMYAGRMVEKGSVTDLLENPQMRYTQALLESVPKLNVARHARLPVLSGRPPDLSFLPPGCAFSPRCKYRLDRCLEYPEPVQREPGHFFNCWNPVTEAQHGG